MKYFLCLIDFCFERALLFFETIYKKKKYLITKTTFIKTLNTSQINSRWLDFYKKFRANVEIISIDREKNLIELKLITNYRHLFFYRDAGQIKTQLIKMKELGFVHKDFDFGNMLIKDDQIVILDPGCWVLHNSLVLDMMIEACEKKDILLYKKYKKILKREIEHV